MAGKMDGKQDQAKGRMKEAAGALTDDDELRREGKLDQFSGDVKEKSADLSDAAAHQVGEVVDKVKHAVRRRD